MHSLRTKMSKYLLSFLAHVSRGLLNIDLMIKCWNFCGKYSPPPMSGIVRPRRQFDNGPIESRLKIAQRNEGEKKRKKISRK